ncbi:hypothetical protein [uncultured Desulfosarcina sp.]|uniref:hypothetical protein n=1 Tax=uncultured Desulfosarcina sp. TaxID=218289 RepID=UPI0029C7FE1F|nr:hypothetical protein [uncultured Desulfosarcina sp.]
MRKFIIWIKNIFYWFTKPYLFWITIVVLAASVVQVLYISNSEASFRITGLVLQILGIGTVAYGIHDTRKMFGHPSFLSLTKDWLKRFPKFGGHVRMFASNIQATSMVGNVRGYVWMNAKDDSNEERIKAIEINLESVNKRLCESQNQIGQCEREIEQGIKKEQDVRTKADRDILDKIEAIETGGLHISAMGVVWLFVGVIMSSIPAELSKLIK